METPTQQNTETQPATTVTPPVTTTPAQAEKPKVPSGMKRLVALRPVEYQKKTYKPGEEFFAKDADVAWLTKKTEGGYKFAGERIGADAKERHIIARAELV